MNKTLVVIGLLFLVQSASIFNAYSEESKKVFILKHPDASKGSAFVLTSDIDRLTNLIDNEGYQLVAKKGLNGPEPVLGDVVPQEAAMNDAINVASILHPRKARDRSAGEIIDLGIGLNVGLTSGGKARLIATIDSGFVVGVDVEVGTIIFLSEKTASAILGYSWQKGRNLVRPYITLGGGTGSIFAILAIAQGPIFHGGAGIEWKRTKWFGIGLEGGLNVLSNFDTNGIGGTDHNSEDTVTYPYARLNFMFYLL